MNALENKIPDVSGFVKKTDFNTKATETEGKIPSIRSLATNSALYAVENKIPDVSIRKNIFACMFSVHNTKSLSRHEQVCLMNVDTELKKISDRITSNKSRHLQIKNKLKN